MSNMIYTGVGARKAPPEILEFYTRVVEELSRRGYTARTGDAVGMDSITRYHSQSYEEYCAVDATAESCAMAARWHPAWFKLSDDARKLHGRNPFQVLGRELNKPSKFMLCWTPDGAVTHKERSIKTGGTGTAISIADYYNVPVFNLKRQDHYDRLNKMLKERN